MRPLPCEPLATAAYRIVLERDRRSPGSECPAPTEPRQNDLFVHRHRSISSSCESPRSSFPTRRPPQGKQPHEHAIDLVRFPRTAFNRARKYPHDMSGCRRPHQPASHQLSHNHDPAAYMIAECNRDRLLQVAWMLAVVRHRLCPSAFPACFIHSLTGVGFPSKGARAAQVRLGIFPISNRVPWPSPACRSESRMMGIKIETNPRSYRRPLAAAVTKESCRV
jgi:hypothetical protein